MIILLIKDLRVKDHCFLYYFKALANCIKNFQIFIFVVKTFKDVKTNLVTKPSTDLSGTKDKASNLLLRLPPPMSLVRSSPTEEPQETFSVSPV